MEIKSFLWISQIALFVKFSFASNTHICAPCPKVMVRRYMEYTELLSRSKYLTSVIDTILTACIKSINFREVNRTSQSFQIHRKLNIVNSVFFLIL